MGTPVVLGVISMGELAGRYDVPRRDTKKRKGYQREATTARVNKLVTDLRQGRVDLPTTLLLNLREFDASTSLANDGCKLYLDANGPFYVVDGQHRIEALFRLFEEDPDRWSDYQLSFVCLLGAVEYEEMRQFYVVNSTAKAVKTDLALDLLKQQAETDPEFAHHLTEQGLDWKVKGETLISNSGMVTAVKPLLGNEFFGRASVENQVKILDAYWQGIRKVLPEAFADPWEYGIQKQTGAVVMNKVLITMIELIRSESKSLLEPENYAGILRVPLSEQLEGDTHNGDIAVGIDFWLAGPNGAAGSYSSGAGQRVLTAKIKALLPQQDVS
jgi:DGQHR domain-containing protein